MILGSSTHEGVTGTVYVLQKGERIPRCQRPLWYATSVIRGRTELAIDGKHPIEMHGPHIAFIAVPANLSHEITALEDDTVVLNLIPDGGNVAGEKT